MRSPRSVGLTPGGSGGDISHLCPLAPHKAYFKGQVFYERFYKEGEVRENLEIEIQSRFQHANKEKLLEKKHSNENSIDFTLHSTPCFTTRKLH